MAEIKPTNRGKISIFPIPSTNTDFNSTIPAKVMAGIPNKKENRAAVARSKPRNNPAVMVEPERDTPGIKAKVCANPINISSRGVRCSKSRFLVPIFSANPNKNAITIEAVAITSILRRGELS